MVLVSNEWQNKSEDEQKSSTAVVATTTTGAATSPQVTTTTTTAVAITTTISPATATVVNADNVISAAETIAATVADSLNSKLPQSTIVAAAATGIPPVTAAIITPAAAAAAAAIKTIVNDNNNEKQKDKNAIAISANSNTTTTCNNNKINDNNEESNKASNTTSPTTNCKKEQDVLNYSNIKIMAENTKETPQKEMEEGGEPLQAEKGNDETIIINTNETVNETGAFISPAGEILKDLNESNSYPNSNTNTLQPSVTVKTQNIQNAKPTQQQQMFLTADDLDSSLQMALNATALSKNSSENFDTTMAAAGMQSKSPAMFLMNALVDERKKILSFAKSETTAASVMDATQTKNHSNLVDALSNSLLGSATITSTLEAVEVPSSDTHNGQAKIILICEGNSHPFQARTISLTPNVECMVGRLIAKSKAAENNAIFDCKVLSRKHAVIWYSSDGKFWVKDTKSSNGTFINDTKLGDEEAELHFGDIVKFGVDVVENSRKEVHGCIIACVKLYLPDGREAISIDSNTHRSPEGRISFDDLHRLNLYIQETAQREKVLASKLCSIQNILDATRKNSALCWQAMITEDQLLHRIHSLEKKLSFMEKNVPENVLRNEVLKLLDDKNSYQHTAKEALRKVYQERCDAMQMLAKMESAYTQSDNECALLRDQIMNSKQTLQDVNARLLQLETEYNEYREEIARQQQEAKEREEQHLAELTEKLHAREMECDALKKKISDLLIKRADLLDDADKILEKQAIEKLDAAIADMDLGDDDDDDDDDEDPENDIVVDVDAVDVEGENIRNGNSANTSGVESEDIESAKKVEDASKEQAKLSTTAPLSLTSIFGDNLNGLESEDKSKEKSPKMSKHKKAKMLASLNQTKSSPPKRVKESTIMKWLQNSDLNKNEGSLDIFKAICNENEDEDADEFSTDDGNHCEALFDVHQSTANHTAELNEKCSNFTSKLKNVEENLKQLEAEIKTQVKSEKDTEKVGVQKQKTKKKDVYEFNENSDEDDDNDDEDIGESGASAEEDDVIINRNGKASTSASSYKVLSKNNKKYQLLKSSVNMLREAYNEIRDTVRDNEEEEQPQRRSSVEEPQTSTPPLVKLPAHDGTSSAAKSNSRLLEMPASSRTSCDDIDLDTDSVSEVESLSLNSPVYSSHSTIKPDAVNATVNHLMEEQLKEYQQQVGKLNEKLQQSELEAHQTLEIMQIECDDVKEKMLSLNKVIETLKADKMALEQVINENKSNKIKYENDNEIVKARKGNAKLGSPQTSFNLSTSAAQAIEEEEEQDDVMIENDLADINVTALEREEELITYKERLDDQQKENIQLRNEIATLKIKGSGKGIAVADSNTKDVMLKRVLPYGVVALAIIVYFLTTYF